MIQHLRNPHCSCFPFHLWLYILPNKVPNYHIHAVLLRTVVFEFIVSPLQKSIIYCSEHQMENCHTNIIFGFHNQNQKRFCLYVFFLYFPNSTKTVLAYPIAKHSKHFRYMENIKCRKNKQTNHQLCGIFWLSVV